MRTPHLDVVRLLAILPLLTTLYAQSLSGRVVSPSTVPIAGIVVDPGSSTPATTSATGLFTVLGLSNQTYDVEYVPPIGAPWAARSITTVVSGATNVGDVVLQPGFALGGTARTGAGAAVPGCNINVYDQDGVKLFTPRDGTDALGNFLVVVPAGIWDLRVVPPTGSQLVPRQIEDIVITTAAVNVGIVTLALGYQVTGSVVDLVTSLPISATRVKTFDAITGARIYQQSDSTTTFGQFSLLVPYGFTDFECEPPAGNTHVARRILCVPVPGPTVLGQVRLQNGALLSGTVTAGAVPVANADIDVFDAAGIKVFTPRDKTSASGTFTVAVPTGNGLTLTVEPPPGSVLVGTSLAPFSVAGPTNVGTLSLGSGVQVTGTITGQSGGEPDVDMSFFDVVTNVEVLAAGNRTDAAGHYTTHVPAGNYRLEVTTAEGSTSAPQVQFVAIGGPTTIDLTLNAKLARCMLTGFGTPSVPQGSGLPVNVLLHSMVPGLQTILVDLAVELTNGQEILLLPGLPLTLPQIPFWLNFVVVPVPFVPSTEIGRQLQMVIRLRDATGTVVLDQAKTPFIVL